MTFSRASGILLHPTSLAGPFGIGDFGAEAYAFADFLAAGGQTLWQVLPLGPTGYGNSPYSSYSAFAGNTLLISPENLSNHNLLPTSAIPELPAGDESRIDFEAVEKFKCSVLRSAFAGLRSKSHTNLASACESFCRQHAAWLDDYALFKALFQRLCRELGNTCRRRNRRARSLG